MEMLGELSTFNEYKHYMQNDLSFMLGSLLELFEWLPKHIVPRFIVELDWYNFKHV